MLGKIAGGVETGSPAGAVPGKIAGDYETGLVTKPRQRY